MYLSRYFLPTLKENPAEAQIVSHRLMLRAGMICQSSSGIYTWLPLGWRVMEKLIKIISEEHDHIGCHKVIMPTIQSADLWRQSGRYEAYGKEMLRFLDRHEREMLYGPTNEEAITEVFRHHVKSYRQLPQILYQIQWKFRDEIRPRFGVMRGREFLMKDAYSFDLDEKGARQTYAKMFTAYLRTFSRMGLTAIPVRANTGAIGGDLSHEFHIMAATGESSIYYDQAFEALTPEQWTLETTGNLYSAADEMYNPENCPLPAECLRRARGIEVGHVFNFGTKYSKTLDAKIIGQDGHLIAPNMGSYGIGVSRLVAAIIEANHDTAGIIWPVSVAPFKVGLINVKIGDVTADKVAGQLYKHLTNAGIDVLYDDREERAGAKFADMDLIGLPWQMIVGIGTLKQGTVELKERRSGMRQELSIEAAVARVVA